jgi:lipopolysaccharide export system protein LptA
MNSLKLLLAFSFCAFCMTGPVHAERADRDKPVKLEADRVSVDDIKRVHVFEGNVALSQGTMSIRTAKLVVTQDAEGFQKVVASGGEGGLVRFRQKREGSEEYVEGEAERLEYDARTEQAEFSRRARLKSGRDEMQGAFIFYDGLTEKYSVNSSPTAGAQSGTPGRVTAVIQPKNAKSTPDTTAPR